MKRCTRCVIPDTRPDTAFVDGVCSACLNYDKRAAIDWGARMVELKALLDRHDGKCIVASSGGKDSHFQVRTLLDLGADVTVVTATTCHLTEIGRRNIDNLARYARTIEVTPNRAVRANLNRLGLEMVGDISWPEHVAIFTTPFRMAAALDIELIFYGECPQEAYGGPLGSEYAKQMTSRWRSEYGGFLGLRPSDVANIISEAALLDYEMPPNLRGVEAHFLGQYVPWDSHRNAEVATAMGMECSIPALANIWAAENLDNAQTGIHDHLMYRKYGYGRGAAQASVDVRAGRIKREAAIEFVDDYDGYPPFVYARVPLTDALDRIGITEKRFWEIADQFTDWSLFDRGAKRNFGVHPN